MEPLSNDADTKTASLAMSVKPTIVVIKPTPPSSECRSEARDVASVTAQKSPVDSMHTSALLSPLPPSPSPDELIEQPACQPQRKRPLSRLEQDDLEHTHKQYLSQLEEIGEHSSAGKPLFLHRPALPYPADNCQVQMGRAYVAMRTT